MRLGRGTTWNKSIHKDRLCAKSAGSPAIPVERRYWQTCDLPGARFTIGTEPGFYQRLLVWLTLSAGSGVDGKMVMNTGTSRLRKEIRRTVGESGTKQVLRGTLRCPRTQSKRNGRVKSLDHDPD